jgi:hypothetical protein
MFRRKSKESRSSKVSIDGHYDVEETGRGNRRVWVPDQLVVECGCGKRHRPAEYPEGCECRADHTALVHEIEQVLVENSFSLQVRDFDGDSSTRVVYKASDILLMLTKELSTDARAKAAAGTAYIPNQALDNAATLDNKTTPSFVLEDAIVVGNLDLKHRTIERPVVARNCWFTGSLDLRYCEFKQAVCFLDCTFFQQFNSGDTTESLTIYKKELNCTRSTFKKTASFNGMQVESTAYFHDSRFELETPEKVPEYPSLSEAHTVDFAMASFGHHLECKDAFFRGRVSFNSVKCGVNAQVDRACFKKEADFTAASFGRNFECIEAEFRGPAIFNSLRCDGNGHFDRACFKKEVDFTAASFGRNFECTEAEFRGPVYLDSLECGGIGFVDRATFIDEVSLKYSSWKAPLQCEKTTFQGHVDCSEMSCDHDAIFENTQFKSDRSVVLSNASFGGDLRCKCAVFNGPVHFKGLKCEGAGGFQKATFVGNMVDFQFSHFGRDLDLRGAYFAGRVRLARVSIRNRLRLGASCFLGEVELYSSEIRILELIEANYPIRRDGANDSGRQDALRTRIMDDTRIMDKQGREQEIFAVVVADDVELRSRLRRDHVKEAAKKLEKQAKILDVRIPYTELKRLRLIEELFPFRPDALTLTDISFDRFHGGPNQKLAWELALRFCEGQDPARFSRDPYMQLEKYYSSIGEDDDALDIHYRGHCAIRENAKASRSKSRQGRVDWPWLKIWTTDLVWKWLTGYGQKMRRLLVTFLIFVTAGTYAFWSKSTFHLPPGADGSELDQQGWPMLLDRMVYSADLLIPVLDLRAGDTRIADSARWFYEVVHIFAGWLLVALLIAWITAIAKGSR